MPIPVSMKLPIGYAERRRPTIFFVGVARWCMYVVSFDWLTPTLLTSVFISREALEQKKPTSSKIIYMLFLQDALHCTLLYCAYCTIWWDEASNIRINNQQSCYHHSRDMKKSRGCVSNFPGYPYPGLVWRFSDHQFRDIEKSRDVFYAYIRNE